MAKSMFKEKQRFKDLGIFVLVGIFISVAGYGLIREFFYPRAYHLFSMVFFSGMLFSLFVLAWWLAKAELSVTVNEKRISYKLYPLHSRKRKIPIRDIQDWEIIKTPSWAQWHGWNIAFGYEKRCSLCGRNGLFIRTKNREAYFIGSRNAEELEKVVSILMTNNSGK